VGICAVSAVMFCAENIRAKDEGRMEERDRRSHMMAGTIIILY
jgi:hypothetical protein